MSDEQDQDGVPDDAAAVAAAVQVHGDVMASQAFAIVQVLAPHIPQDAAQRLAESVVQEQLGPISHEILPSLVDPDGVARYPTLILRVGRHGEELRADVRGAKRLERVTDPGAAVQSALLLALLTSPAARAILRAFGWTYTFAQSPDNPAGSIILSS